MLDGWAVGFGGVWIGDSIVVSRCKPRLHIRIDDLVSELMRLNQWLWSVKSMGYQSVRVVFVEEEVTCS